MTTRIAAKPVARIVGVAAISVAALLGTSACSLIAPVATQIQYDPADGVGADLGDVKVRDMQILMGDSGAISVYLYAINSGADSARLSVAVGEAGVDGTTTVTLPGNSSTMVGGPGRNIIIESPSAVELGGMLPVYVQAGDATGQMLSVPVLDAEARPYFAELLP